MVCTHHQATVRTSNRVLRHHTLTGFDVAHQKILLSSIAELQAGGQQLLQHGVRCGLHVHDQGLIGIDNLQTTLGVFLVSLLTVRQTHGDELRLMALLTCLLYGSLRQTPSRQGVHAPADPQDQAAAAGTQQIVT